MSTKFLLRSFAGGEVTPELAGRLDLTKYQTGLALARNFLILPHGPAARRSGFEFTNEVKDSTNRVRLIPFAFNATQTAVLEFGNFYIRFHIDGGTVLEATKAISSISGSTVTTSAAHGYATGDWVYIGTRYYKITVTSTTAFTTADLWGVAKTAIGATAARVYTLTSTYAAADLFDLHFTQSADVITIVHPNYPARELRRLAAVNWQLVNISFAAPSNSPTGLAVYPVYPEAKNDGGGYPYRYVVTTVAADGVTESLPTASVGVNNNLTRGGNYNSIRWNSVAGASRYNVYKLQGGVYGYMGHATPETGTTPKTISSISRPGAGDFLVTVVTSTAHGYATTNVVLVEDTGVPTLNGSWVITVVNSTTFTYESDADVTSSATTGTVSRPALSMVDDNVRPDNTQTPPEDVIGLNSGAGDYPTATTYHEQRRWFAGTGNKPQVVWATRNGTETNLTTSIPARDADAIEVRVASMQNNQILHLVPLTDLIALTGGGEFRLYSDGSPAITPNSITIKPQGYSGANNVQPVVTSGSVIYVQAQGSRVRELAYGGEAANYGFKSTDVSLMAPHRFNGYTISQLAYVRAPEPTVWAVRSDGTLLGMTYVPEQQVYGWHAHDTDGQFESVCVVAENNEDVLYVVVKRRVNGRDVRYIERLRNRIFTDQADAFFVDSGLTYEGAAVTTISGLWHLEGKEVDILADGAVEPRRVVTNGQITLGTAATKVHVGLPITADLRTLPLTMEGVQASGQGTVKNINKVHLRVSQSSVVKAGPTFTRLREYPARDVTDPYGSPPALRDGELSLSIDPSWTQDTAVCVRQDLPLPLTVLSMTIEIQSGG